MLLRCARCNKAWIDSPDDPISMTCSILRGKNFFSQGLLEVLSKQSPAPAHLQRARASIHYKKKAIRSLNKSSYETLSGQQGPQVPAEFSEQVGHILSPAWPKHPVSDRMRIDKHLVCFRKLRKKTMTLSDRGEFLGHRQLAAKTPRRQPKHTLQTRSWRAW